MSDKYARLVASELLVTKFESFRDEILYELNMIEDFEKDPQKDILIVVHNQLDYIEFCVETIKAHTKNYNLYIWDNASEGETKEYLDSLKDVNIIRNEKNLGFIIPNNELIKLGKSPYVILLNSDTIVTHDNWAKAMIAFLEKHPECAQVGYMGSTLNKDGMGEMIRFGWDIAFVSGWAFCISREIYNKFGLFDQENLEFAYCEDSDFSLRLRDAGKKIYSLHLDYVLHAGNKTIDQVKKTDDRCEVTFAKNHEYIRRKWSKFLLT